MTINKGVAWEATQGEFFFLSFYFRIYILVIFAFSSHFTLHWGQCKFQVWGRGFKLCFNFVFLKQKNLLFVFAVFKDFWLCMS